MRLRVLLAAVAAALAVTSTTAARPAGHRSQPPSAASILGTWFVQVTPQGPGAPPPFQSLLTFTRDHDVVQTESDQPGTGLGSWRRVGPNRYAFTFEAFQQTPAGKPNGYVVVSSVATFTRTTYSGPFTVKVFSPAGTQVASGGGTAAGRRFVIPPA